MDNLTHSLAAVILSRAGMNRLSPRATLLLVIGANAPDLDVLAGLMGPDGYLRYHRGPSHSFVAMPLIALAVAGLIGLFRPKGFRWGGAYMTALIGVASNPLLDLANSYGVRILWPFTRQWFSLDFLAIFDVWIWLVLAVALVAPWLSRLVSSEIGASAGTGRGVAIFALCLVAGYGLAKYLLHQRALAVLDSRLYRGQLALRVAAMPSPVNPFRFVGLVEGDEFVERHPQLDLLREFDPTKGEIYYKPSQRPRVERLNAFLDFAQWPVWRFTPLADPEGATRVEVSDLRFGPPGSSRFEVSAQLDAAGRTLESGSTK